MTKTDVRERLLTTGVDALHRNGFNATGVQDITSAAGVPKGSFYNHFESKEAFGAEVVRRYRDDASWHREILSDRSVEPRDRLVRYFTMLNERSIASNCERGCLLGNFGTELASQSPLIRDALAAVFAQLTDGIASVIAEAQRGGTIGADLPAHELATFVVNGWQGATMRAKVEKSSQPLDVFLRTVFAKVLV